MSAAPETTDPYLRRSGVKIPERNTVIPPWAPEIRDFSVTVKRRNKSGDLEEIPPGFTIGEVAPEYRWAINPETGVALDQHEFNEQYKRWYVSHYTMAGKQVQGEVVNIPSVLDFVSRRIDPNNIEKVVPMDYDPDRPIESKPLKLYRQDGEEEGALTPEQLAAKKKQTDAYSGLETLVKLHASGDITDEVFLRRSKELVGETPVVGQESAPQFAPIEGFEPAEKVVTVSALCGKPVEEKHINRHQAVCKACDVVRKAQEDDGSE